MERFDIPVALIIFKRDKAVDIVRHLSEVKPQKLYLLADQGRNEEEKQAVSECRAKVEAAIDWDCEVIKHYAEENVGVYQNIAGGAKWVLSREKWAIFLEDDNLPETTFFPFCKEMLERYEHDERVLWVCGTNYLGSYTPKSGDSYVFTKHMLPCGWASWARKFTKYYDGDMSAYGDPAVMKIVRSNYCNNKVYKQYKNSWRSEYNRIISGKRPISWDYQMDFSIKAHGLYGVCPCNNQIKNIGVDECSIHGGTSFDMIMTQRFCGMDSYPMEFPIQHPTEVKIDPVFEKRIGKIILFPLRARIRIRLGKLKRRLIRLVKGK